MKIYGHWQNLNRKPGPGGRTGNPLKHGRAWLHLWAHCFRVEWSFQFGVALTLDLATHDDFLSLHLGLAFLQLYFGWEHSRWGSWLRDKIKRKDEKYGHGRSIGVRSYNWCIWVRLWEDPMEWRSEDPKWWQFAISYRDIILGLPVYETRELERTRVEIAMPEGVYPALVVMEEATWKRPRWFTKRINRARITPYTPVPFPGKGENSWDCGEDAAHSMTVACNTPLEAVMAFTESVLKSRWSHGGSFWRPQVRQKA